MDQITLIFGIILFVVLTVVFSVLTFYSFNDDKSLGEKIGFTIGAIISLIMIIVFLILNVQKFTEDMEYYRIKKPEDNLIKIGRNVKEMEKNVKELEKKAQDYRDIRDGVSSRYYVTSQQGQEVQEAVTKAVEEAARAREKLKEEKSNFEKAYLMYLEPTDPKAYKEYDNNLTVESEPSQEEKDYFNEKNFGYNPTTNEEEKPRIRRIIP